MVGAVVVIVVHFGDVVAGGLVEALVEAVAECEGVRRAHSFDSRRFGSQDQLLEVLRRRDDSGLTLIALVSSIANGE